MKIKIIQLQKELGTGTYKAIESLFKELYDYMATKNLILNLVEGGESLWMKSIQSTLGKLSMIYAAYDGDKIIGFVTGIIRLSPAYLGNKKVGYLSHLYIQPKYRRSDLGKQLTQNIEVWFKEKNVDLIEVEILTHNTNSIDFFTKQGYQDDILKKTKHAKIS